MFSEDDLAAEWQAALAHSAVDADSVAFWPVEGHAEHSHDEAVASTHPPERAWEDERFLEPLKARDYPLDEEMRARVAFFVDFYDPQQDGAEVERVLAAGILRHELEHVNQLSYWHSVGCNFFDFDGVVDDVLDIVLRNPSTLYHAKPVEQDANGAASRHLAKRFDDAQLQVIHKGRRFGELVRWRTHQPPQTLLHRTLAFCLMFRPAIEVWEKQNGRRFAEEIEGYVPGASGVWERWVQARPQNAKE